MSAPCLDGPEPPAEITMVWPAGYRPAWMPPSVLGWTVRPASTSPAAPGRLRTASASVW